MTNVLTVALFAFLCTFTARALLLLLAHPQLLALARHTLANLP